MPPEEEAWPGWWSRLFYALLALAGVLGLWAFLTEPATLTVSNYYISLPNWPQSCDGLRVAVLVDLPSAATVQSRANLQHLLQRSNSAQPDLLLLPQGLSSINNQGATEPFLVELGALVAPHGVYVLQNAHGTSLEGREDVSSGPPGGLRFVGDSSVLVEAGQCQFRLAAMGSEESIDSNLEQAFSEVSPGDSLIVMMPKSNGFPNSPEQATLSIAGHSAGSQVLLPVLGRLLMPSHQGQAHGTGHSLVEGRHYFVGSKLNTHSSLLRSLVPSEITILTLSSQGGVEKQGQ